MRCAVPAAAEHLEERAQTPTEEDRARIPITTIARPTPTPATRTGAEATTTS